MRERTNGQSAREQTVDAVVIGGGPAGAATACRAARLGRRVVVVERQSFPRFHIGESLLPASNATFERLGLSERLASEGFVEKFGASFATEDGLASSSIDFSTAFGVDQPRTYQVPRARFDQLMLDHAAASGATVLQPARVRGVDFEANRVLVEVQDHDGATLRLSADVVVDASGQAGFLAKRLGLRRSDEALRHVATFAHFEGVERADGEDRGNIRVVSRPDLGWLWFIPLSETVTSVGVVVPRARHDERPKDGDLAEWLDTLIAECPEAARQMTEARRIGEVRVAADYSYSPTAYAGDRWLLVGDAGSFLDPVFSSGVLLALESGVEAAEAIDRALDRGRFTARSFAGFAKIQRRRYRFFRRFVHGFYDPAFRDLFFAASPPHGMKEAVASALAGHWRPPLSVRWRLALFFALARGQRWAAFAPRIYSTDR